METKIHSGMITQKWLNKFINEYVSGSGYKRYMGASDTSIIRVLDQLKDGGDTINIPLSTQIKGRGVRGDEVLSGNEAAMGFNNDRVTVFVIRQAVSITENQTFKTILDLFGAARGRLKEWFARKMRTDINTALRSVIVKGVPDQAGFGNDSFVAYEDASAAQLNAFLVNNTDRVQAGLSNANTASGNWATTLGTLTVANDKLTFAILRAARDKALRTESENVDGLAIAPVMSSEEDGTENYVFFASISQYNDLKTDSEFLANNRSNAAPGYDNNPLWMGGDLVVDNIIVRRISSLPTLGNVGSAGAQVEMGFLCGQSAVVVAYGKQLTPISQDIDYAFRKGVGMMEIRGQKKVSFNGQQYGVVTVLSATANT